MQSKVVSLSEAVATILDGSQVAIGGHTSRRHPVAAIMEMVRQRKRDLHLLGWNSGIDFDLLVGAGCATHVQTSYIGFSTLGLAPNFRRAAEAGTVRVTEHSETTAIDAFRAGAMGLTFFPSKTPLGSDLLAQDDAFRMISCPFTNQTFAAIKAFRPDVAVLHAHRADLWGNVQLSEENWRDTCLDELMARSAQRVIVTVEQIVSPQTVQHSPRRTILPRSVVDYVVQCPYGAHPTSCDLYYRDDVAFLKEYMQAARSPEHFQGFLQRYVLAPLSHAAYLELLGARRLLELSVNRVMAL